MNIFDAKSKIWVLMTKNEHVHKPLASPGIQSGTGKSGKPGNDGKVANVRENLEKSGNVSETFLLSGKSREKCFHATIFLSQCYEMKSIICLVALQNHQYKFHLGM